LYFRNILVKYNFYRGMVVDKIMLAVNVGHIDTRGLCVIGLPFIGGWHE
jgi:hypothetical protein